MTQIALKAIVCYEHEKVSKMTTPTFCQHFRFFPLFELQNSVGVRNREVERSKVEMRIKNQINRYKIAYLLSEDNAHICKLDERMESIKGSVAYDNLEIVANDGVYSLKWDEILSIYSVLSTTNNTSPIEVFTVNQGKKDLLKSLFEEMNDVGYSLSTEIYTEVETVIDDQGNETEESVEKTKTTLTIRLSHISASEEASRYGFDEKQMMYLEDMLLGKYSTLRASIIGGYSQGMGIIPSEATWIGTGRFSWPLPVNGTITSGFGYRSDPFNGEQTFHGGLDIAADAGTPIIAAEDGIVTVANGVDSWGGGYGFYVMIDHSDGFETLYGHCSSICVVYGQSVRKGEVIAYVGSTGNSTGNHLHFEIRINSNRTDPLIWFR